MKRTFLWLAMSIIMYGIYMYTLPFPDTAGTEAQAAAQTRVSARIVLPKIKLYAVSLGTYDTEEEARPDAARYSLRGAAGRIVETDTGWALLGAAYDSDADARSVCARLNSSEGIDAQVVLFTAEEVRLSVNAAVSQTEALSAALEALNTTPGELMSLSETIDSGACDAGTVRSLLNVRAGELDRLRKQLEIALGDTADIFSRMVETRIIDLCEKISSAAAENGPAGLLLSSALKQCAIDTRLDMISMMNTLR